MAYRIHDHVTHGEIDNRERGRVTGKIWLHGNDAALVLDLAGNAGADIAGCLFTFRITSDTFALPKSHTLFPDQKGSAGDMTASRKVRVPDVPFAEFYERCKRGEKPPEHMGNSLYLEWYSQRNGRVVIETTDFTSTITEPEWTLTREDEAERGTQSAEEFAGFLGALTGAVEQTKEKTPWDKENWDEFDHERMLRENVARIDKYSELLDKYGDSDEAEKIIAKEMGWDRDDENTDPAWIAERDEMIREMNEATASGELEEPQPDPATEGVDWIRAENGDIRHPLQHRVFDGAIELWHRVDKLGLGKSDDPDLSDLISNYQILGGKLAGALNGLAQDRGMEDYSGITALMKRALTFLHDAQAALEKVVEKHLLPAEQSDGLRKELFAVREEMLRLMTGFRGLS